MQYYTLRAKKREKAKNLLFCHAPISRLALGLPQE
jgi:hypothetical protein